MNLLALSLLQRQVLHLGEDRLEVLRNFTKRAVGCLIALCPREAISPDLSDVTCEVIGNPVEPVIEPVLYIAQIKQALLQISIQRSVLMPLQ